MGVVTWKLRQLLQEHDIRPLDIEREAIRLGHALGKNVIYRLMTEDGPKRVDRRTITSIIAALRSLTNERIDVGDLMEFVEH